MLTSKRPLRGFEARCAAAAIAAASACASADARGDDGVYGRFEGDLELRGAAGVSVAAGGPSLALDAAALDSLVATAAEAVDSSVSFYDFTNVINERLTRAQKVELLEMLWRVAQADGRVDHYEEYYIRRLADLLHLSHGDFIRTKLAVLPP